MLKLKLGGGEGKTKKNMLIQTTSLMNTEDNTHTHTQTHKFQAKIQININIHV